MKKSWVAALCTVASLAFAHDTYLMPQRFQATKGQSMLLSLHNGDSFPDSEGPVDPTRIVNARMTTASGSQDIAGFYIGDQATHTAIKVPSTSILSLQTKPRFLEMAPDKFEAYVKEEGLNNVLKAREGAGGARAGREQYSKYAKTYVTMAGEAAGEVYRKVVGLAIEIVPEADPALLKPGAQLPVRVLFQGKPAADLQVIRSTPDGAKGQHTVVGRTDAEGRLSVPIQAAGKHRLHAIQMVASQGTPHDWESFWASFTFEVSGSSPTSR